MKTEQPKNSCKPYAGGGVGWGIGGGDIFIHGEAAPASVKTKTKKSDQHIRGKGSESGWWDGIGDGGVGVRSGG